MSLGWRFHILLFIPAQPRPVAWLPLCTQWQRALWLVAGAVPAMLRTLLHFFLPSVTLLMKFFPWGNFYFIFLIGSVRFDPTDFD